MQLLTELSLASQIGQLRAAPVKLGGDGRRALFAVHGPDFDVDPYHRMFFFPKGRLELLVFTVDGEILWRKDLGGGVVPGQWFCPVFPFDLNEDGVDEIWYVGNPDQDHPLDWQSYRLYALDARTGEELGNWPWPPAQAHERIAYVYRNFILGGYVHGRPVLVTAQGTYGTLSFQGWNPGMSQRWSMVISEDSPGARGSHMCPVVDWNEDNVDEFFWGERLIEMDQGRELLCIDRDRYRGHSDIVQPVWNEEAQEWHLYTCRESDPKAAPRVALWNVNGELIWGDLDQGHIDMGWVARLNGRMVAMAIRIQGKTLGPDGRHHQGNEEFAWDLFTGKRLDLGFSVYRTLPVDVNGDGDHELIRGIPGGDGRLVDSSGNCLAELRGLCAMASQFCPLPGEQLLMYHEDGSVRIWYDPAALDAPRAVRRYEQPFYMRNQALTASGANGINLSGI